MRKWHRVIFYTSGVIAFLSQILLSWQRGLVVVEFAWHHSIARSRKPAVIHKDLADISYIRRVIADFVPNFVAIAKGVIQG